jgi:Fic family protein
LDLKGRPFTYRLPPAAHRILHLIDTSLGGTIGSQFPQVSSEDERKMYLLTSLREEAISSSLIEGAVATREEAKEMIRSNRKPRTQGERMILNNYMTIWYLNERKREPLTTQLLYDVQRRLTDETLERPDAAGRFRLATEKVTVWDDEDQQELHMPPPAGELKDRIGKMCDFANRSVDSTNNEFIHPAIRAILLHFWLAYDHPFVDGNGRTARALFYWSMLRQGYWLTEYISISRVIAGQAKQYARAYLNTEHDENDLTYFVLYHLRVIEQSLKEFQKYLERKQREQSRAVLVQTQRWNSRQRSLVVRAMKDPTARFSYESHARSHGVVLATARTDLLELEQAGILVGNRVGRRYEFMPAKDIEERLKKVNR